MSCRIGDGDDSTFLTVKDREVVERNKQPRLTKREKKRLAQPKTKVRMIKHHETVVPEGYSSKGKKDYETNLLPAVTQGKANMAQVLKLIDEGKTFIETAKLCKVSVSTINAMMVEYRAATKAVESYRGYRSAILADMQRRILNSISDLDIKKAPLGSRILALCQLYDKERLENDLSTANIATLHDDIATLKQRIKE